MRSCTTDGLGCVERRYRKTFFGPNLGKLTGSRLYNPAKARRYGGRNPGTTLTRRKTMCRFPLEADAVEEETQAPEGLFRTGVAAYVPAAKKYRNTLPTLPVARPVVRQFNCR